MHSDYVTNNTAHWIGYNSKAFHLQLTMLSEEELRKNHIKVTGLQSFILAFSLQEKQVLFNSLDRYLKESLKVKKYFSDLY